MKPKGLLIAAGLLALLGGGVWWSERDQREKAAKPPADAAPKILALTECDIVKVEIRRAAGESATLQRDPAGAWKLTAPVFSVDRDAVSSLITALSSIGSDKLIEEKPADLKPFGLNNPATRIAITLKGGKTRTLSLGDDAPVGAGTFVQADGDARVFTIAAFTKTSIDKFPADLRDKRLLTFDAEKLARLEWTAKGSTVELSKNASSDWAIIKPKPARADGWQVEELLRKLKEAKLDPALTSDQQADLAKQFAKSTPVAAVSVTAGDVQKLEIRKSAGDKPGDEKYYAHSSVVDGFHLLTGDLGKSFDKPVDDLRNKKLFDFGFSDPTKVEFKGSGRQLSVNKAGDRWLAAGKEMDPVGVQSLIDRLRELSASKFVETGFSTSTIELAVTSKDGKLVEKVSIAKSGAAYIARREGEPGLYQLEAKSVHDLTQAAAIVKEKQAPPPAKK